MSGFPRRATTINALGPELENTGPIRNPKRHVSAGILNLMRWQVAGSGLVVPRVVIQVSLTDVDTTPVIETAQQLLSWDSPGDLDPVTWVYDDPGKYSWTFPSGSYEDQNGDAVTLDWIGGAAFPSKVSPANHVLVGMARVDTSSTGQVLFEDLSGPNYDDPVGVLGTAGTFLLLLW
jgi:hypothetical protein